jgi:cytochrome c oxidase subunit IV
MADTTIDNLNASHETADLHPHEDVRTYYVIFAWLMGLLALTVIASLIPFDKFAPGLNVIIALIIAIVKAALVVMFFMHVKHASKLTWAFASAAFLWLAILLALTFNDYLTRRSLPGAPSDQPPAPAAARNIAAAQAPPLHE